MEAAGPAENRQADAGFPPVLGRRQTDAGAHSYHSPLRRTPLTDNKPLAETGKSNCRGPARIVDAEHLRLSQERKDFGIANVLEHVLASQDVTRARTDHLNTVAEFDKAQYALLQAIGGIETVPEDAR